MTSYKLDSTTTRTARNPSGFRFSRFVYWGTVIGFFCGIVTALVLVACDGYSRGMSAGTCVAYSGALTLLMSQPAGILGMVGGAVGGAFVATADYARHHFAPPAIG